MHGAPPSYEMFNIPRPGRPGSSNDKLTQPHLPRMQQLNPTEGGTRDATAPVAPPKGHVAVLEGYQKYIQPTPQQRPGPMGSMPRSLSNMPLSSTGVTRGLLCLTDNPAEIAPTTSGIKPVSPIRSNPTGGQQEEETGEGASDIPLCWNANVNISEDDSKQVISVAYIWLSRCCVSSLIVHGQSLLFRHHPALFF